MPLPFRTPLPISRTMEYGARIESASHQLLHNGLF
jgi:hypothetical protein